MPEIALIPPYSLLSHVRERRLQMLLPACLQPPHWRRNYRRDTFSDDAYIILDNGLFEGGRHIPTNELFRLAAEFWTNEIVLPDIRDDGSETVSAVQQALQEHEIDCYGCDLAFMVVVQGRNQTKRIDTINALAQIVPPGTVFGFPRRLTQEDPQNRLKLIEHTICSYGYRFPLHMLGLSREWPGELLRAARQFGSHLRGLDTSAPYTYAFFNNAIQDKQKSGPERTGHYFVQPARRFPEHFVAYNTYVLDSWAKTITPVTFDEWYHEVPTRQKSKPDLKDPQAPESSKQENI